MAGSESDACTDTNTVVALVEAEVESALKQSERGVLDWA